MKNSNKFLSLYLWIVFGVAWSLIIGTAIFAESLKPFIGELSLTHPLIIFVLYLPSLTGLAIYYKIGGMRAVRGIVLKLIPRSQDLYWFPLLFVIFALFALSMRYACILMGVEVPAINLTASQMVLKALWNFIEETGLLGGIFGWIGFLLPALQAKLKNNIPSALLTGLIFGLWVFPGYGLSSIAEVTSYVLYVIQLMSFILFASYIFNVTKGNLSLYLFSFWLAATGSHIQLYYFNTPVQLLEIFFLISAAGVMHLVLNKTKLEWELQVFPNFIAENSPREIFANYNTHILTETDHEKAK